MNRTLHHARKRRQLRNALKRAKRLVAENRGMLPTQFERLRLRIQRLIAALRGIVSNRELSRMAGGLIALLGLWVAPATAQNFNAAEANPFGLGNNEGVVSDFQLVDLDGDGDLDLIGHGFGYGSYYSYYGIPVTFQENTGTPNAPNFAAPVNNAFASVLSYEGWDVASFYGGLTMEAADLDGDGDYDLLAIERYGYAYSYGTYNYGYFTNPVVWIENTGTATSPVFVEAAINPFGLNLEPVSMNGDASILGAELMDLDGDGDLDFLGIQTLTDYDYGSQPLHGFFWCENIGSATAPNFAAPVLEPFGLHGMESGNGVGLAFHLDAVDLDEDGDLDLLESVYFEGQSSDYLTELHYFQNTGSSSNPVFGDPVLSPFGLLPSPAPGIFFSEFADLDGDGDFDICHNMISDYLGGGLPTMWYQENLGGVNNVTETSAIADVVLVYPNPVSRGMDLRITLPGNPEDWKDWALLGLTGQIAFQSQIATASNEFQIPTQRLASGIYQLKLTHRSGAQHSHRIVID